MRKMPFRLLVALSIVFLVTSYKMQILAFNSSYDPSRSQYKVLYHKAGAGLMPQAFGANNYQRSELIRKLRIANGYQFAQALVYFSNSWPETVVDGFWNLDSQRDALISTSFDFDPFNDNQVHLFAQTATGILTHTQRVQTGSIPMAIVRGDFNHDGQDDAAVVNQNSDSIGVFLQNGGGTLSPMVAYPTGVSPDGVVAGDFNGDLLDDLAVSHAVTQQIYVYYQQPDGTMSAPVQFGISSGGYNELETGDINGDGYDDLVMLRGAGHTTAHVAIFYQQNRTFAAPVFRTAEDGGFLAHGLAVGDVTSDGRDDIVVTAGGNVPHAYINVFPQQSDGSLATSPIIYPAFHLPEAVEIGDVNHDGRNDVVLVHAAWLSLSLYLQNNSGTLNPYEQYLLPYTDYYRPDGLALGDVSNDGGLDVLIANHSDIEAENGLVVLTNTGTAPTSTITIPNPGLFISNTTSLQITGQAGSNATTVQVSTNGGRTWATATGTTTWSYNWNIPAGDGSYIILSRAIDGAGRVQSPPARSRVIADRTVPTGSLLINNGASLTNNPVVTLTLNVSDFNIIKTMRFENESGGFGSWVTYTPTYTWTLSGGDGTKTVSAQVRDIAGNVSTAFSDTIILDTTAPTGGCVVVDDNGYVNTVNVVLSLNSSDTNGVTAMQVRNSGDAWGSWIPYGTSLPWTLTSGDGSKTIECRFQDTLGNVSVTYDSSIILDTTPPSCNVSINNGAPYTTDRLVTLGLNSTDSNGVSSMRFSNDGTNWIPWEPYNTSRSWTLSSGDGTKTVWTQFRDVADNVSQCTDTITLDTQAPQGTIVLANGAAYTGVITITVTLNASDSGSGVDEMCLAASGISCTNWQPYATAATWVLDLVEGTPQEVCVEYKDNAGNVSTPACDSIILDISAPTGSVLINNDATYTSQTAITLTLTANDTLSGVDAMRFSLDGASWTGWQTFATTANYALGTTNGTQTVYVQFRDLVGNLSTSFTDTIIFDDVSPSGSVVINNGAAQTNNRDVVLTLTANDNTSGVCEMQVRNQGDNWGTWQPFISTLPWTLGSGSGVLTVEIRYRDCAGNDSSVFSDSIQYVGGVYLPLIISN